MFDSRAVMATLGPRLNGTHCRPRNAPAEFLNNFRRYNGCAQLPATILLTTSIQHQWLPLYQLKELIFSLRPLMIVIIQYKVQNIMYCRQIRNDPWPQKSTKKFVKCRHVFLTYASATDIQTCWLQYFAPGFIGDSLESFQIWRSCHIICLSLETIEIVIAGRQD